MNLQRWLRRARAALEALADRDPRHRGRNQIQSPASEADLAVLRRHRPGWSVEALGEFYAACDGLNWPHVWNGYFVHPLSHVVSSAQRGEPHEIRGPGGGGIVVFGSDGGGGLFAAMTAGSHAVVYLPNGAVHDGIFDGEATPVRLLAASFSEFLDKLLADLEAYARNDPGWTYMV